MKIIKLYSFIKYLNLFPVIQVFFKLTEYANI